MDASISRTAPNHLALRVGFPLRGPRKPPGQKSPKKLEKIQNCIFGVILPLLLANVANLQGQFLAEWILAVKLPDSGLNFAVDF